MNLMVLNFLKKSFIYYSLREFKVKKKKKKWAGHEVPPIKPAGKPVKPAGKPVAQEPLNFKPVKPTGKPVGTGCMGVFEFI